MVAPALYHWPLYFLTSTLGKIRKNTNRYKKNTTTILQCEWALKCTRLVFQLLYFLFCMVLVWSRIQ